MNIVPHSDIPSSLSLLYVSTYATPFLDNVPFNCNLTLCPLLSPLIYNILYIIVSQQNAIKTHLLERTKKAVRIAAARLIVSLVAYNRNLYVLNCFFFLFFFF